MCVCVCNVSRLGSRGCLVWLLMDVVFSRVSAFGPPGSVFYLSDEIGRVGVIF